MPSSTPCAALGALLLACLLPAALLAEEPNNAPSRVRVLFLGDHGLHQPARRFAQLQPELEKRSIALRYTDSMRDITPQTLGQFDALLIYANIERIEPDQEQALLDFVENGGGLVALHSASYCFHNSPQYIALVGAQFQRHGTGTFRTQIARPNHPLMQNFGGFESWDETYVHTRHNEQGRTVLTYRVEGNQREPWTWVREQGKGRVFYTAWGHDERTWGHPGFQNLVERGIRWATRGDLSQVPSYPTPNEGLITAFDRPLAVPEIQPPDPDAPSFEYVDVGAKIPNYPQSDRWGTQAEPLRRMQKPLSPEDSRRHLVLPEGFEARLFASEDLWEEGKPIAMAWDARGRLWLCLTMDYPNQLHPPGQGRDKIIICEDTDGDAQADRVITFADKLSIPTSIAFYRGGAIVQDGTETVFLKDTDGDDIADQRQVLFSGWNMRDTHGGVSNFQYGHDNWIWAMQGYNDSHPVVRGQEQPGFRNGFFRFRPDGSELEFIRSTDNNTWGVGISEEGNIFGSTANRNPSVFMPIPNRYYEQVRGWTARLVLGSIADTHLFNPVTDKVRQVDHHGGYTAAAGHSLYTARNYPQTFWNRVALVNGPTGHLTGAFVISREGSGFRSTNPFNFVASDDEWTAPIQAEVGPDGNVWVLDWYNYIVQHNPTPHGFETGKGAAYETDLRDQQRGRIYRIVYTGNGETNDDLPAFDLHQAAPEQLVQTLTHKNLFWRRHAQRLLVERAQTDVVPALVELTQDQTVDPIGLNVGAIHALWTLDGLGVLQDGQSTAAKAVHNALKHPSPGVRRNAVQVLPRDQNGTVAILSAGLLDDVDPQVRLMALLALADRPAAEDSGALIAEMLQRPENANDRWIPEGATAAAANDSLTFLLAVAKIGQPTAALRRVSTLVAQHYARGAPGQEVGRLIAALQSAEEAPTGAIMAGLSAGWPQDRPPAMTDELEASLERLSSQLPQQARANVIRLGISWGSERLAGQVDQLVAEMLNRLDSEELSPRQTEQLAREVIELGVKTDPPVEARLLDSIGPQMPAEVAQGVLRALSASPDDTVGPYVLASLPRLTPAGRQEGIGVLLSRPAWSRDLLNAIDQGHVQLNELALDQRQALSGHPDAKVREQAEKLFQRGGALPSADRQQVIEQYTSVLESSGDAAAGKLVFKRECAKCHTHGGEGSQIGPDLTGMAVHPKEQLLAEILDPNRSVEANYRTYLIATLDGRVLSGLLASESRTAIELIDAEGKQQSILREDIDQLKATPQSLMPVGFEKQIAPGEMADLLAFLTRKGPT